MLQKPLLHYAFLLSLVVVFSACTSRTTPGNGGSGNNGGGSTKTHLEQDIAGRTQDDGTDLTGRFKSNPRLQIFSTGNIDPGKAPYSKSISYTDTVAWAEGFQAEATQPGTYVWYHSYLANSNNEKNENNFLRAYTSKGERIFSYQVWDTLNPTDPNNPTSKDFGEINNDTGKMFDDTITVILFYDRDKDPNQPYYLYYPPFYITDNTASR